MKDFYKKKKFTIPVGIIILLVALRVALPAILLHETNKYLSDFSPTYYLHMEDLDISIIRGSYRFEEVTGKMKNEDKQFLSIETVDVSIAWREVFKGKIVTDIVTEKLDFLFLKDMSKLSPPKKEAVDVKDTLFPVKVESLDLKHAKVTFEEYPSLSDESRLRVENINGIVTNLTPDEEEPLSDFNLTASLQGSSVFVFIGEMNLMKKPMLWAVDVELKDFDMTSLNAVLKRNLPLTFTKGKLDLYAEAKKDESKIKGYIKPFMKDIDVVANKEKFVGLKHFGIEILMAIGNLFLRESDTKSLATYVDFVYDGTFNTDGGQALSNAIEHGFKKQLSPGLEHKYHLE